MPSFLKTAVLAVSGALALAAPAQAVQIADEFTRVSPEEMVTAPFTAGFGVSTQSSYSGFVEIRVSGTGFSLFQTINDAFYFLGGGATADYYQLGIGTSAEPFAPFVPTNTAARLITFIDGVGYVPAGTEPVYDPTHVYRFVIDLDALSTPLTFGVLDGNYADNGGQFELSVWQLRQGVAGVVPEPGTWLFLILGFGAVGGAMRARARTGIVRQPG